MAQTIDQSLVHKLVEEFHLLRRMLQHIVYHIFQHALRQHHVIGQICEGDLRLNHPEFRRVTGSVGVLRPEGRSKGVDVLEGHGEGLAVQLAAHRQVRRFSEEVLGEVHRAVLGLGYIAKIHRGNLEHLSGTLTVTAGNQRCVHIDKIPLLEKFVDRVGDQRAHPEHRLEGVGAGAQMADGPQILERVALLLQRVIRCGRSLHHHLGGLDLEGLLCLGRQRYHSGHDNRGTHVQFADGGKIIEFISVNDLQRFKERTVAQHHETECLGIPDAPHPAADGHFLAGIFLLMMIQISHV